MIRIIILLSVLFWSQGLVAQEIEDAPEGEVEDAEIVIEKDRVISLPRADKVIQRIGAQPSLKEPEKRNHEVQVFDYDLPVDMANIETVRPETTEGEDSYNHYLRAGFGNYTSPLIKAYFNTSPAAQKALGLSLEHESFGSGEKDGKNSAASNSAVGIKGALLMDKATLSTYVDYSRRLNYFYGYNDDLEVNRDTIEHSYNFLSAGLKLQDANLIDEVGYLAEVNVRSTSDNLDVSETSVSLVGSVDLSNKLFLDGRADLSQFKGIQDLSRNHFRFKGFYRVDGIEDLILDAGLMFSTQNDNTEISSSQVFPYINAQYALSSAVTLNAVLDAGYLFNNYFDLARENFYLGRNIALQNSEVKFNTEIGMDANLNDQLSLGAKVSVSSIENLQQLANDYVLDSAMFNTVYNPLSTSVLSIGVNATYVMAAGHTLQVDGQFMNYSSDAQDKVYHLPGVVLSILGQHRIMDPLSLKWNFKFMGGLHALSALDGSTTSLSSIPELNLVLDYQISEKAGAFLSINNLLNTKYERYLNYVERGLQLRAGVSFRF